MIPNRFMLTATVLFVLWFAAVFVFNLAGLGWIFAGLIVGMIWGSIFGLWIVEKIFG